MDTHDERYMGLALDLAKVALDNDWIPVGAVFVRDNRIIVHGRKVGGSLHALFDHAEHNACYQALWDRAGPKNLDGCTVYSTLEPCLMCMSMLLTTRVSRIVYGLEDPYGGGGFILKHYWNLPPRFRTREPAFEGGVRAQESKALLRQFFERQRQGAHWNDADNPLVRLALS